MYIFKIMKKNNLNLLNLTKEAFYLIVTFFKPYHFCDNFLNAPKNVKSIGFRLGCVSLLSVFLTLSFSFLLQLANNMVNQNFIILGIILFMLYKGQHVIAEGLELFISSEKTKFQLIFDNEILIKISIIISKVSNKVVKYYPSEKLYKLMPNEVISNSIKNFLRSYWDRKINNIFEILSFISVIIMLITAIIMNSTISQPIFIGLIVIFSIISFLTSAIISKKRFQYHSTMREENDKQSLIMNDMLRVQPIVQQDFKMRLDNFVNSLHNSNKNETQFYKKLNLSYFLISLIETLAQYGIIISYLLAIDFSTFSLATFTEITATTVVVQTALGYIRRMARKLNTNNDLIIGIKKEEENVKLILDVFNKKVNSKPCYEIKTGPWEISYLEESENDKPFKLILKEEITIKNGEIAVLYGPSGSGKSTFLKLITERISLNKDADIPSTSRFSYYEKSLKFGSLNIFDELFCCEENPNLDKMQDILTNLFLFEEISSNCINIWQWMKEKKYESLSDGQQQRIILAKQLYFLDDSIDVVILDEATSGLDDITEQHYADANKILSFIINYCNNDKKRILVIATHQNIDLVKEELSSSFKFKNFYFCKDGKENIIKSF